MSLVEQTKQSLNKLRLNGMQNEYELILSNPKLKPDSQEGLLARLTQAELDWREKKRLERTFCTAKLRIANACVENVDFSSARGLDRDVLTSLAGCDWVGRSQNVILTGCSGTGKTHLACALGNQAVRRGYTVLYKRLTQLLEELELAQASGTLAKVRAKIAKVNLLIMDDWGIAPMSSSSRLHLLDVVEQRAGNGSLIITAQLPVAAWHDYIGEPTIADAILDRIVHRAHKIELRGESMRKLKESV